MARRTVTVDKVRPGQLIAGTWAVTWPTPRRLTAITPSSEHSLMGQAYRLTFDDDGHPLVLYGQVGLQLA